MVDLSPIEHTDLQSGCEQCRRSGELGVKNETSGVLFPHPAHLRGRICPFASVGFCHLTRGTQYA